MYLSTVPNPEVPEYCYHQYLWAYFNKSKQESRSRPFVFRILGKSIIMLSREKPTCHSVNFSDHIKAGQAYQFQVLASPVRGTYREEGKRKRRQAYKGNKERLQWLQRRLGQSAELEFGQVFDRPARVFKKGDGHRVVINECIMSGVVYVKDKEMFNQVLINGVGGRGAWGCGLMILPEVMV